MGAVIASWLICLFWLLHIVAPAQGASLLHGRESTDAGRRSLLQTEACPIDFFSDVDFSVFTSSCSPAVLDSGNLTACCYPYVELACSYQEYVNNYQSCALDFYGVLAQLNYSTPQLGALCQSLFDPVTGSIPCPGPPPPRLLAPPPPQRLPPSSPPVARAPPPQPNGPIIALDSPPPRPLTPPEGSSTGLPPSVSLSPSPPTSPVPPMAGSGSRLTYFGSTYFGLIFMMALTAHALCLW